jgi:hypothetical protein
MSSADAVFTVGAVGAAVSTVVVKLLDALLALPAISMTLALRV